MDAIARILDANLDRAREGLRVLEEWFRFGLESADLAAECKDMRQTLAQWHREEFRLARNTPADPGTQISHPNEVSRQTLGDLLQANCSRIQEALRVLEEYAKLPATEGSAQNWVALSETSKQLRYRLYTLESQGLGRSVRERLKAASLYLVTMPTPNWLTAVESALQGGVTLVQYRCKEASDRERIQDLQALKHVCVTHQALLIVNDRVDLALAVDADGIHVGQTDLPVATVRRLIGPHKLIGQSTTNPQELESALASDVDYVGVGPVYATPTKAGKAAAGLEYVRWAAATARIPWFAIGGIDLTNLDLVAAAGARQVAVVRSLMTASDPQQTATQMRQCLQSWHTQDSV